MQYNPLLPFIRKGISIALPIAIVALPISMKIPIGPVNVRFTELIFLLLIPLLLPELIQKVRNRDSTKSLQGGFLFLSATALTAAVCQGQGPAFKETVQIGLYVAVASLAVETASEKRDSLVFQLWTLFVSWIFSIGLILFDVFVYEGESLLITGGRIGGIWNATLLLVCLLAFSPGNRRWSLENRTVFVVVSMGVLSVFVATTWVASTPPKVDAANPNDVPQRYLEAFAALSVLSDWPLFGLGPGNYQDHIAEYYQGMPKDNSILYGTRIGWTHLCASVGLMGTTAFVYWLLLLWEIPRNRFPVAALCLAGFVTPLLSGNILIILAVLTGIGGTSERPDS